MAYKCTICCYWHPKEWDGHKGHWADITAHCEIKNRFTTSGESCESGALVRKAKAVNRVSAPAPAASAPAASAPAFIPVAFTGELYQHQKDAVERFKDATEIALFMEQGVGKTATILRVAGHKFKKGEIDALLVVAPNDVHLQWQSQQLPLWLDCAYDSQCLFGRGGQKVAYPFQEDKDFLQVVCVNIDTFSTPSKWQDIVDWANSRRTMIVLDEADTIKNPSAKRTERMLYAFNDVVRTKKTIRSSKVKTVARAILTGTPVTNGPMDAWAMFEFLRPNYFGRNWYSFQAHFGMFTSMAVEDGRGGVRTIKVPLSQEWWEAIKGCNEYGMAYNLCGCSEDTFNTVHAQDHYEGPYKHADELRALMAPVAFYKLLKDCVDMPPQTYQTKQLTMAPELQKCYDSMVAELMAEHEGYVTTALSKLTAMIRLQQICSGFLSIKNVPIEDDGSIVEDDDRVADLYGLKEEEDFLPNEIHWVGTSNPKLDALYRDVAEAAKPLIILTRFTAEADRIYNDLCKDYRCCLMTGWKRVGTVEEFQAGAYDIMVANSTVVARGLNLQNSCHIMFYSNTFSLATRLQAEGRIFRLGQTRPCVYNDYAYTDTIDEKITAALSMKRNLLDYIRGCDNVREVIL